VQEQSAAGLKATVELAVIKNYLQRNFAQYSHSSRFLTGGVTFCAMLPMRSIPFPVICLIGMNNEAYPRQDRKIGFDLMELKKRAGDRSLRREDQYLFLEAILAAGKNLIISYIGQDAQDNSTILPSISVSELLDYIDQGFCSDQGGPASEQLMKKHHLHGFNPAYFRSTGQLGSYSQENFRAAEVINTGRMDSPIFAEENLSALPSGDSLISINELILFYRNPAHYFLEKSLCLKLDKEKFAQEEAEPFVLNPLTSYQIKQELLERKLLGADNGGLAAVKRAKGVLPVGLAGDYYFESLANRANDFAQTVKPYLGGGKLAGLPVDITIAGRRLVGIIDNLYAQNHIHYRLAKLKPYDYLQTWINHLLINIVQNPLYPADSVLIGEDKSWRLNSIENARQILETLVMYYEVGQLQPLKYFPCTSLRYAEVLILKKNDRESALNAARVEWMGDSAGRTDSEAETIPQKICFADAEPLDAEFEQVAIAILGGLFSHLKKLEK
jgi:exodeoxyribonuclease V gamma subunit